jgi:hypothetical protein
MDVTVTRRYREKNQQGGSVYNYVGNVNSAVTINPTNAPPGLNPIPVPIEISKSFVIEYPTDSDVFVIYINKQSLTINSFKTILVSSVSSPSLTIQPYFTNDLLIGDINYFTADPVVVTETDVANLQETFVNPTIPKDNFIVFQTSAISGEGDIDSVHMTFDFTIN